ncbi:hypothetical protein FOMPIDRAFT_20721, partial [Fomitopsis schrenkii]
RFCKVPTYGRDTIRRFSNNVSDLKQMAARMYEDILQCIMPVVEDLLPAPHNDIVLDMLFSLAEFHAFAKMRLHTERTLELFEQSIKTLGVATRKFETVTCVAYDTKELPRETAARDRREAAAAAKAAGKKTPQAASGRTKGKGKAKPAAFQLSTIKYHSFGDYPDAIRAFGTLDVSSTQQV